MSPFAFLYHIAATALASSTLQRRGTEQCGQYESQTIGPYTLYTNGWGWSTGTGSQCSQIDNLSGNSLSWETTWSWSAPDSQVKSFANVETSIPQKPLSAYSSIATTWSWVYTGSNITCDGALCNMLASVAADKRVIVAYDTFLGPSASGGSTFEVMVWLGLFGESLSPLSTNGYPFTPIASPTIDGVAFDLAYGINRGVGVYSFVAHSRAAMIFSGDLLDFYSFLEQNYADQGFTSDLYLQSVQAGTEAFEGSLAVLTTSEYSIIAT